MGKLVIVESPSKCNQIEKYLGEDYKVLATYGHFRELTSLKNIIFSKDKSNVTINFTLDSKKEKNMSLLKKHIDISDEVILATDDDREGESIAWHICDYFKLQIDTTKRIIFHEITKNALQEAVANPTIINMNIVQAQFTRQILDLMIGFKISPLLWRYIATNEKNSLSAGRCQTPALKLIYDNYITNISNNNNNNKIIYKINGYFTKLSLPFKLNHTFNNEKEVTQFLKDSVVHTHTFSITDIKTKHNNSPIPLNTSRLQQMASNELHLSPKETMRLCQTLYEKGFITYMRTENTKYSGHFVNMVKQYLLKRGDDSLFNSTDSGKFIEKNSKAHEAIRPTNINLEEISDKFDSKIRKMYKLIWENSIVSCLEPSVVSVLTACLTAPNNYEYTYDAEYVIKLGWTKYKKINNNLVNAYNYLKTITKNTIIPYYKINATFDMPCSISEKHYTESRLIKLLEEEGIGRPSTFAMIVDKIQSKEYVNKENIDGINYTTNDYELTNDKIIMNEKTKTFGVEKNKLIIKTLGMVVLNFIYKHFEPIFNYEYTRNTELILDQISQGNENWITTCVNNKAYIDNLIKSMKINGVEKFNIPIDDNHTYMMAKYGPVIKQVIEGVTTFLPVRKDIELSKIQNGDYELNDLILDKKEINKSNGILFGKLDDKDIFIKTGKYGRYASWGDINKSLKCFGSRDIKNITMEEMTLKLFKKQKNIPK